ncbi:uracil phosphoribosyltransferase [Mucilaginibacter phyllosphaerae]|uniref:Uracil phosphoribosyltransferase n=1 Tax=Mucilaginibacter phyllosphaerae TaxID=1812349 RepID=A0A4Y8ABK7_9SPHI|nr:uracil phosphoribosyltransferase [Mucilaginibacter phyllosphaerae]MBB3969846.1 uracil phosphoribosyltransferase [Mucilaginibacter phyllosphaerae]TEW65221.1 uracil phosphoribosyltransferase [Mucilaginibacter phyllosphaerae]GGH17192.1 uracil phosphoribosyltransferase [Mucilaginibacter phyllosphaerae]
MPLTQPFILNKTNSIANQFLAELRDVTIQQDKYRFRKNQERLGEILAYEISKILNYKSADVQTPLGTANINLAAEQPVVATILRAGLPFHQGFINFFDRADSAFITACRKTKKSGAFTIQIDQISAPNLDGKTLIMCDTMLATGQSTVLVCKEIIAQYQLKALHIAAVIASNEGIAHVRANLPNAKIWTCAVDDEMTSKAYIVPGLGDAGDLAFGEKV